MFKPSIYHGIRALALAAVVSIGGLFAAENASAQFGNFGLNPQGVNVNPMNPYGYYPGNNPYAYNQALYNQALYNRALYNQALYNRILINQYIQRSQPFSLYNQRLREIQANRYNNRNPSNLQFFRGPSGNLQVRGGVVQFPRPVRRR